MGKKAMGAILDAPIRVGKDAATIFHQIQGTKAEETVEILSVTFLMTREELTFLMGKVLIVIRHFSSQLSARTTLTYKDASTLTMGLSLFSHTTTMESTFGAGMKS